MPSLMIDNAERLEREIGRARKAGADLRGVVAGQRAADIARVLDRLSPADRDAVFAVLDRPVAARVLRDTATETTKALVAAMDDAALASLLDLLPMDEAARILSDDIPQRTESLLAAMEPADASEVKALLAYPANSAGRLMTEQFATVEPSMTAEEAIAHVRSTHGSCETITDLYHVDGDGRLQGVMSLRELIVADPATRLSELLVTDVVSVLADTNQEDVARLVGRYDFLAIPVVDPKGRMLGVITVDDVIDVLVRAGGEDLLRLGGMEGGALNQPYFSISLWRVVRRRIGWLLLLFVAETATGTVLRTFEGELAQVVALSFFIPLLIGTGGNTGAQTVSTLIRGLALSEVKLKDTRRVLKRELMGGLSIGLLLGTVGFFRALLWHSGGKLSLVIALTLVAICIWANVVGALIPLVATKFKIDPAVVSAPLITTLVDATGLAIYLLIAKAILGL
jgi:magnesium transporter